MNKSKKIKKVTQEVTVHDKNKDRIVSSKILTIASIICVVILVGAILFDRLYESPLLTVDGERYGLKDLSYYFHTIETQYESYDQMFGGTGAYWDMTSDETTGATMRDAAKETAINTALYNEVLYNQATSEGYTLTDEEKTSSEDTVTKLMTENMSKEVIAKNGFTKKNLLDVINKITLVDRYHDDKIEALDIDDEAIKAGVKYDDYRQYDIEYLFTSTNKNDADGKSVAMTDAEKADALSKLNTYAEKAKTTEDWSKLIPEDEKVVSYRTGNFIESDTKFDEKFKAVMMAMDNKQVGDIYEAEGGYYLVRMINNNSSESYDEAVKSAITKAETEGFQKVYEGILKEHEHKINYNALKTITMGNLTLVK